MLLFFSYILIQFLIFSNSKLPEMVSPFILFLASVARFYMTCSVCLFPALFVFIYLFFNQLQIFWNSVNIMHGQSFVKGCYECLFFFLLQSIRLFIYFNVCVKLKIGKEERSYDKYQLLLLILAYKMIPHWFQYTVLQ